LKNLATHGRLLDTVRNVTDSSTNSSMLSDKKEELQVMNIHGASGYQSILAVETKSCGHSNRLPLVDGWS
jgi:hypothetical protein